MDVVDDGRRAYERVDSTHGGSCCFDSLAGGIPVTEVKRQEFNLVVFRVRPPGEACVDRGDAAAMSEQVLDDCGTESAGSPRDDDAQAIRLSAQHRGRVYKRSFTPGLL
jgi:hypothetical protein